MSVIPNLFIAGAAKSGTSSMYEYLRRHPDIFMTQVKEPHYLCSHWFPETFKGPGDQGFSDNTFRNHEKYLALFEDGKGKQIVGEASVYYLYFPDVPKKILELNPDAKVIIMLRNPVERAFSAYMHTLRDGRELLSFEEALKHEATRRSNDYQPLWWYREIGYYSEQVKRYLEGFDRDHLKIILYEDLKDAQAVVKDCFEFLGVSPQVDVDTSIRYNASGKVKSRFWYNFFDKPNVLKEIVKPLLPRSVSHRLGEKGKAMTLARDTLAPQTRQNLIDDYRDDVLKLQELIGRDLSSWLK